MRQTEIESCYRVWGPQGDPRPGRGNFSAVQSVQQVRIEYWSEGGVDAHVGSLATIDEDHAVYYAAGRKWRKPFGDLISITRWPRPKGEL